MNNNVAQGRATLQRFRSVGPLCPTFGRASLPDVGPRMKPHGIRFHGASQRAIKMDRGKSR
jgi:hypothetical protein